MSAEAGKTFIVALACAAAAVTGAFVSIANSVPPAAWWPAGVALGAAIGFGRRTWPGILLGWLAGAWIAGMGPAPAACAALTGTVGALAGAWIFRRHRVGLGLDRFRDVGWLVGVIIPLSSLIAAVAGTALLALAGPVEPESGLGPAIAGSWAGHVFSAMALVPLMLGIAQGNPIAARPGRWAEFFVILGLKALSGLAINLPLPYPVQLAMVVGQFPLLAWMAVRFNLPGIGVLVALSLVFAMFSTAQGAGPLAEFAASGQWITLTAFCAVSTATALLLYDAMEATRRMQRELGTSERRLRDIADSASDFFWETDGRGRLLYVSERFADFVGRQTELLLGRVGFRDELANVTDPDWPTLLECMRQRQPYRNLRVPVTTMAGDSKVLLASGKPVFDETGAFKGYRGACTDITEQVEASEALFQAQKMESVGQLTGGLAHDFNNLLAVMIGNMELAEETLADDAQAKPLLRKALSAAERGATLIQRLLAFSRRQALSPRVVDVNGLITGLSDILEHSLGDAIHVRRSLQADPWLVRVDPSQLESVILNLALNARDAMGAGGRLTIATRNQAFPAETVIGKDPLPPGDYMAIEVADTGTGMTQQTLERIFEPFFTTKDTGRGSGLGLSMAYGFVRQSGGAIKAESAPGKGTRMVLYLPRHHEPAEPAAAAAAQADAGPPGKGEHILLVEDDPSVRDLLARRLARMGYRVLPVDDAAKALEALPRHPDIDLLLTDVVLPGGLFGDKLALQARALRPGLKVLFMSGYPKNAMDHMGNIPVDAPVLRKPFRNQELAEQLRALLDRPRALDAAGENA